MSVCMNESNNLKKKQGDFSFISFHLLYSVDLLGVFSSSYWDERIFGLLVNLTCCIHVLFAKALRTTTISRIYIIWSMRLKMVPHLMEENLGLDLIPWSSLSLAGEDMLRWPQCRYVASRNCFVAGWGIYVAKTLSVSPPKRWAVPKTDSRILFLQTMDRAWGKIGF